MIPQSSMSQPQTLDITGSSTFGRYPKISKSETWNMIISDNWLVPFAGYEPVYFGVGKEGRATYASSKANIVISVIDNIVYRSVPFLDRIVTTKIDVISTYTGDVFIAENNNSQIAICDKVNIYVYNYSTFTFEKATTTPGSSLDFTPVYICYQDTYIVAAASNGTWRLSNVGDATQFPADAQHTGEFQTKADTPKGVIRMPGKGNMLLILGSNVGEIWYDLGLQLFPYQKDTYNNIDYGVANQATIASLEDMVVWVSRNEQAGITIMFSDGNNVNQISTDGINFKLATLEHPTSCYGFLFRQDGHLLYIVTFYEDNYSLIYDFNTKMFFNISNHDFSAHIAKQICYFNNRYYFVARNDGNIYEMSSNIFTYNGNTIPRVRITKPFRLPDQSRFVVNSAGFTLQQGESSNIQRIDLALSVDGGEVFGSYVSRELNNIGRRPNKLIYYGLGSMNDLTLQFRFYGNGKFVATDGVLNIYQ